VEPMSLLFIAAVATSLLCYICGFADFDSFSTSEEFGTGNDDDGDDSETSDADECDPDVQSVMEFADAWRVAADSKDLNALMSMLADDAVLMSQGHPDVVGKEAIRAKYEENFSAIEWETIGKVVDVEVSGDLATYRYISIVTARALDPAGQDYASSPEYQDARRTVYILKRQNDGSWKLFRLIGCSTVHTGGADDRINRLERNHWYLMFGVGVAILLSITPVRFWSKGSGASSFDEIVRARGFHVVNENDETLVRIEGSRGAARDYGTIATFNESGHPILSVGAAKHDEGGLVLFHENGGPAVWLYASPDGSGTVSTMNRDRDLLTSIATNTAGQGMFIAYNDDEQAAAYMSSSTNGTGYVVVNNADEKPGLKMFVDTQGAGQIIVQNGFDSQIARLGSNMEGSGVLELSNSDGQSTVTAGENDDGLGCVRVYDPSGQFATRSCIRLNCRVHPSDSCSGTGLQRNVFRYRSLESARIPLISINPAQTTQSHGDLVSSLP
jgi:ketosteroid isomerase-like protein